MKKRAAKKLTKKPRWRMMGVAMRKTPPVRITIIKPSRTRSTRWTKAALKRLDRNFVDCRAEITFRGMGSASLFESWLSKILNANGFPTSVVRVEVGVEPTQTEPAYQSRG